jgi:phosphoglycerate dehydrogenase-like enzyme
LSARRAVLNLRDTRPVWALTPQAAREITAAFPEDWDVVVLDAPVDGRGDGRGVSAEALAAAPGTEVWFGYGFPRELFAAATAGTHPRLRWVHTGTAGVGSLLYPEMRASDIVLTNSAGIHAPPMAETVLAMILHFARGLDFAVRAQSAGRWDPAPFETIGDHIRELNGLTLGIVGLGGIGRELAWRARAFGMHVLAARRSARPAPEGVELLTGEDAVASLLGRSDAVVIAVPSTADTRGLIDAAALARMRPAAVLVNVARGDVVDEDALADALRSGRLRGAALDVFAHEPLPAESPLWQLPNVLILPHVSATTPRFWERERALITDNIARYLRGEPLRNMVDRTAGY